MVTLWQLADGSKTNLGAAVVALATFFQLVGVITPEQLVLVTQFFAPLIGFGLGHKVVKAAQG